MMKSNKAGTRAEREARLAEALKANIKRRKAQARARAGGAASEGSGRKDGPGEAGKRGDGG